MMLRISVLFLMMLKVVSLSKEKGNIKKYELPPYSKIIGHSVIANYLVLFSASSDNRDSIVKIDLDTDINGISISKILDLGFDHNSLIETDAFYENEKIIKVYWVDGINQKRFINIMNPPFKCQTIRCYP